MSAEELGGLLVDMFPRWSYTDPIIAEIKRRFSLHIRNGMSTEQGKAVINQHRFDRRGNDPDLSAIDAKMRECVSARKLPEQTRETVRGTSQSAFLNHIRIQRGLPQDTPDLECYRGYYRDAFRAAWNSLRGTMPRYLLLDAVRDLENSGLDRRAAVEWVKSELPEYLRTGRAEMPQ